MAEGLTSDQIDDFIALVEQANDQQYGALINYINAQRQIKTGQADAERISTLLKTPVVSKPILKF